MQRLTLFFLLIFSFGKTYAQPQPCGPDAEMTPVCIEACVICDIDGFTGINDSTEPGEAPDDFCTTTVHHAQWIAFIAGSESLTIELQVFGCQGGGFMDGLEVGIYESLDCENFNLVSNCNGDIGNNTTGIFITNEPLTIGQYYYWVMDGNGGDICNYTINVVEGTTEVPPLPPAGNILGEMNPCQGESLAYSIPPITGANFYEWTVDGQVSTTTDPDFDIDWMSPGTHQVCVTAFNVCDTIDPICIFVDVQPPLTTSLNEMVCAGDCFAVGDTMLCDAGTYDILLESFFGCDSMVNVTIEILQPIVSNFEVDICDDDSIEVAGIVFYPPGNYQATTTSWQGCDSTIDLTLTPIICEMEGAIGATSVFCHGDETGSIVFSVISGTPPFTYSWQQLDGTPSGSGNLANANAEETIADLPPGTYLITINDNFGNDVVLNVNVYEPPPLELEFATSIFNGTNISCPGEMDGTLEAFAFGGTPDYSFEWSNGSQISLLENLPAGGYTLTLTDAVGCTLADSITLTEPMPITFDAIFENPNCDGFETGSASAINVFGGAGPYLYQISGGSPGEESTFTGLSAGSYDLTVQGVNGCKTTQSGTLTAPAIPILDAGGDETIRLAESVTLNVFSSVTPEVVEWVQVPGLSCYDCLQPTANPFETTTYTVTATSVDGCPATDSVTVNVLKVRDLYVPNAFSPNGDGVNDSFTIFGGAAASQILNLKVFSRWGELVFDEKNLQLNDLDAGWDGTFRGSEMQAGVFAWFAEVEFIDGKVILVEGEVSLVR